MGDLCVLCLYILKASRFLLQRFFSVQRIFIHLCTYFPVLFKVLVQFYSFSYFCGEWYKQNTGKKFGHLSKSTGDQNASLYLPKELTYLIRCQTWSTWLIHFHPHQAEVCLEYLSFRSSRGILQKWMVEQAALGPSCLPSSPASLVLGTGKQDLGHPRAGDKPGCYPPVWGWACSRCDHSHIYPLIKSPVACSG